MRLNPFSNSSLMAVRDGRYQDAIAIANAQLSENPEDSSAHFTLAQSYEALGDLELALNHVKKSLVALPNAFPALTLATRCASNLKKYDEAYQFANLALLDAEGLPEFPKQFIAVFKLLSYLPKLSKLRDIHEYPLRSYAKEAQWLRDYVEWYKNR